MTVGNFLDIRGQGQLERMTPGARGDSVAEPLILHYSIMVVLALVVEKLILIHFISVFSPLDYLLLKRSDS